MQARRILIVGPAWVGDMVMAQSLFITLQQSQADVQIDVLAPAWSAPLLRRMPQVNDVISMPLRHGEFGFNVRRRLGISLRARQYNQAIILPRSFPSRLNLPDTNRLSRTMTVTKCCNGESAKASPLSNV